MTGLLLPEFREDGVRPESLELARPEDRGRRGRGGPMHVLPSGLRDTWQRGKEQSSRAQGKSGRRRADDELDEARRVSSRTSESSL